MQECSGRAAWELGERMVAAGELPEQKLIRHMTFDHVEAVLTHRAVVIPALIHQHEHDFGAPLPAMFQLSDRGKPIRAPGHGRDERRYWCRWWCRFGPVTHDTDDPPNGSVLVTTTLTPGLAPLLQRLNGIVAETGSVLSHLAILAREERVATVVGYNGAVSALPEGAIVKVDGETGQVSIEDDAASEPVKETAS